MSEAAAKTGWAESLRRGMKRCEAEMARLKERQAPEKEIEKLRDVEEILKTWLRGEE